MSLLLIVGLVLGLSLLCAIAPAADAKSEAPKEEISDEHLAVIIAAVASVVGKKARIKDIVVVNPNHNPWGVQGRLLVQQSHSRYTRQW